MADVKNKTVISKLEIIRNMAVEPSVKEVCDVMIQYIKGSDKKDMGFQK